MHVGADSAGVSGRVRTLVRAIRENDEAQVEEAVLRLSHRSRALAPLAMAIGAFALVFGGIRLLVTNWRLTLVQILPALWIWLAMADLKLHVLHGKSFHALRGPILIPLILVIVAITAASFFLNAVFAFAVTEPGRPEIRPAVARARRHLVPILTSGAAVGLLLGLATMVVTRWGRPWFTIALGAVIGLMMLCYVLVPARIVGVAPAASPSRRDKIVTTVVTGIFSATVSAPPYILGRIGLLMLGSSILLIPGIVVLAIAATLQAGTTGAVSAVKMSAKFTATGRSGPSSPRAAQPPSTAA